MVSKTKHEFGDWVPLQTQNMGVMNNYLWRCPERAGGRDGYSNSPIP